MERDPSLGKESGDATGCDAGMDEGEDAMDGEDCADGVTGGLLAWA